MAHEVYDGNFKVFWLNAAPANPAAPTVAEINAGTELTTFIPKNGFNPGGNNNRVNEGDLSTVFESENMGTWNSQVSVTFFRDSATDTAWELFDTHGTTGALVAVPFGTVAATEPAMVWPDVEAGMGIPTATAANEKQKFTVDMAAREEPRFNAAIAA